MGTDSNRDSYDNIHHAYNNKFNEDVDHEIHINTLASEVSSSPLSCSTHISDSINTTGINNVCVIGAGVAGIVSIKILREHGFNVRCFEQLGWIGGTWYYEERNNSYSAMYKNMICNTKAHIAQHSDYTFHTNNEFPTRDEFLQYQYSYAKDFNSHKYIQFYTQVIDISRYYDNSDKRYNYRVITRKVKNNEQYDSNEYYGDNNPIQQYRQQLQHNRNNNDNCDHLYNADNNKNDVEYKYDENKQGDNDNNNNEYETHIFDAVVIANGHFTQSYIPSIQGLQYIHPYHEHSNHNDSSNNSDNDTY